MHKLKREITQAKISDSYINRQKIRIEATRVVNALAGLNVEIESIKNLSQEHIHIVVDDWLKKELPIDYIYKHLDSVIEIKKVLQ